MLKMLKTFSVPRKTSNALAAQEDKMVHVRRTNVEKTKKRGGQIKDGM